MLHRASRSEVEKHVDKETKELIKGLNVKNKVEGELSLSSVSSSLKKAIEATGMEFARDAEEVKEALELAETEEDYALCIKHWIGRLLEAGRSLGNHLYHNGYKLYLLLGDNTLEILLSRGGETLYAKVGKPSRLLSRIFGETFTTFMCQRFPFKAGSFRLKLTTQYIPEIYQYISADESCSSCMSKDSREYGLDDEYHPVMAYENSENGRLALLYDDAKRRYVARAICIVEGDSLVSVKPYGAAGCLDKFTELGLTWSDSLEGLKLSQIDYEGEYLFPYVDGGDQTADELRDCLIVTSGGSLQSNYETGRANCGRYCECCEEYRDEEFYDTEDGEVCEGCYEENYITLNDDRVVLQDYAVYVESEDAYYHEDDARYCDYREEWFSNDKEFIEVRASGEWGVQTILKSMLGEALDNWHITEIEGEDVAEYMGWNEEEVA